MHTDVIAQLGQFTAAAVLEKRAGLVGGLAKMLGVGAAGYGAYALGHNALNRLPAGPDHGFSAQPSRPASSYLPFSGYEAPPPDHSNQTRQYADRYDKMRTTQTNAITDALRNNDSARAVKRYQALQTGEFGGSEGNTGLSSWLMPWTHQRATPNASFYHEGGRAALQNLNRDVASLQGMQNDTSLAAPQREQISAHLGRLTGEATNYGRMLEPGRSSLTSLGPNASAHFAQNYAHQLPNPGAIVSGS